MLQQCLNALIKARVPTTIWFLSLMSPLRKSTKIRKKKVISLIPMIPTKWYGNHMVYSSDRRIWKCPCKLLKKNFLAANLTLKRVSFFSIIMYIYFHIYIYIKHNSQWHSHRKRNSYDEIFMEKNCFFRRPKKLIWSNLFKTICFIKNIHK